MKFFGYLKSTVYRFISFLLLSNSRNIFMIWRGRNIHVKGYKTPETFEEAKDLISKDLDYLLILGVSDVTMRRIAGEDLFKSSKCNKCFRKTPKSRELLFFFLCSLKNEASGHFRFLLNEKIFTVDAKINRWNDY